MARYFRFCLNSSADAACNAGMTLPPPDPECEHWPPPAPDETVDMPGWFTVIGRGLAGRCPRCGAAPIFDGYLKVHEKCRHCAAPLGRLPADDAPPYIAMLAVLHVLALFVVFFDKGYARPGLITAGLLLALLAVVCMAALRLAKGAVIGVLLKLGLKREGL